MSASSFDRLFEQSDEALFWGLIARIEDRGFFLKNTIMQLPPQAALLERLASLKGPYDNGGLLFVFECDRPGYGRAIAAAMHAVGLHDGARILTAAFDLFPTQADYDDWDRRFKTIARVRPEFDRLDDSAALAYSIDAIETAAAVFIRSHRQDYEYLRAHPPYDRTTDCYEGGCDAG